MKFPTVCSIYLHCEGDQNKVRVTLKSQINSVGFIYIVTIKTLNRKGFCSLKMLSFKKNTVVVQNSSHILEQCINNNPEFHKTGEKIPTS